MQRHIIPRITNAKSTALERRLCSLNTHAPKRNETITLLRLTIETIAIIAPGTERA